MRRNKYNQRTFTIFMLKIKKRDLGRGDKQRIEKSERM
jgi:hypothetical protein